MKSVLTPRELAEAIGVSESSVKRWADDGVIAATRTAGGHRRIALGDALRFVRESGSILVRPEVVGLAEVAAVDGAAKPDGEQLFEFLKAGAGKEARGLLTSLYLAGKGVGQIVDGPLRAALERLGELWRHESAGIFWEHRAVDLAIGALHHLRTLLPAAPPEAPRAVGGAAAGDPYILPSLAVAATLDAEGFQATNLGPDTPAATLLAAAGRLKPRLVWLSVSTVRDADAARAEVRRLLAALGAGGPWLVVGGRKAEGLGLAPHPRLHVGASMAELSALAKGLAAGVGS